MKHFTITFFLSFFLFSLVSAQENLVPNGNFEQLKSDSLIHRHLRAHEFNQQMLNWETPSYGSTDVINPKFWYSQIDSAKSGQYAAGMIINAVSNHKKEITRFAEYIQCKLQKPLKVGHKYLIKFDIAGNELPLDSSRFIGMSFSKKKVTSFGTGILKMIPQVKLNTPLNSKWQTVVDFFVPSEAYKYIVIGFFERQTNLKYVFYAVDNVSIIEIEGDKNVIKTYFDFAGEEVILSNMYFDKNSSELLSSSFIELEEAAQWLFNHPKYVLEIQGHTDSEGDEVANLALSEARAEAVQTFLKDKGVPYFQLKIKGYGETQPIADNKTLAGRATNRRVVLKKINLLLKKDLYKELIENTRLGQRKNAFEILEQMARIGDLSMKTLVDADLIPLHTDERWANIETQIFDEFQQTNHFIQPALAYDLQVMLLENQSISQADSVFWSNIRPFRGDFKPNQLDLKTINQRHSTKLEQLLEKRDILPHRGIIGMSGIFGLLAIVQQSDDIDFQKKWLQKMENTMKKHSEYRVIVAYLTDKIAINEGRLQVYGTQKRKNGEFYPIEDTKNLNVRRKKMFLPKLYLKK